ncbi:hypothetical protein [Hyphomonas sp. UBA4494]|jgi:hypothetical protein|uniref:hypothetical protein n=1 Tax=Hyphomonas sp. UBA4494 TaxID=1946631 RepID=UPI0025C04E94|nr:hypothetical protein [Hyphomonas sp. UBA4494]
MLRIDAPPQPKRKFVSEFCLGLIHSEIAVVVAQQITDKSLTIDKVTEAFLEKCHIYIICSRPNLWFNPDAQKINHVGNTAILSGELCLRKAGVVTTKQYFDILHLEDGCRAVLEDYPHRSILAVQKNGEVSRYFPANLVAQRKLAGTEFSDCKVLYVGQAFGAEGDRNALDRLRNHATLQRIFADTLKNEPDAEIVVVLANYEKPLLFTEFDGSADVADDAQVEKERLDSIVDNPPNLKKVVCLAEAGLIRYFQPHYNEMYKEHFPRAQQKILDDCFKLDFAAITCEMTTDDLKFRLYSDTVEAGFHHIKMFRLHNPEQRRTFSTFVDKDGHYAPVEIDGPIY